MGFSVNLGLYTLLGENAVLFKTMNCDVSAQFGRVHSEAIQIDVEKLKESLKHFFYKAVKMIRWLNKQEKELFQRM